MISILDKRPLYQQVLIGVVLGLILGHIAHANSLLQEQITEPMGQLGMLVIRLLKALAIPLVLFAILDAFAKTEIRGSQGLKLVVICLFNVSVAFVVGLSIMNLFEPGLQWTERLQAIGEPNGSAPKVDASLSPLKNLVGYVPESLVEPLLKNNVISVVLLALLLGVAFRRVRAKSSDSERAALAIYEKSVETLLRVLTEALLMVVAIIPIAVFFLVAKVVGQSGLGVIQALWHFFIFILMGFAIHALVYYPAAAWFFARRSPREFLGKGLDAILMGLSTNSSLATMPVTLRCLTEKLGVSQASARLGACVGTNLNNDGITLYEAMAALFLAQASGMALGVEKQLEIVLASLMAGIGIAGIPEAGLIVLPLVLSAAGLPEELVAIAIPLIIPVDWVLARCRSAVNVMSDMLVAMMLDGPRKA